MKTPSRNKLTDYWSNHDIKQGDEFAILTNIIHQEWAEVNVKDHKKLKWVERSSPLIITYRQRVKK